MTISPADRANLVEDALDILCQAGGKVSMTEMTDCLRRGVNANFFAASGRKWRLSGGAGARTIRDLLEAEGFTIEHKYSNPKPDARCVERGTPCGVYGCCRPTIIATFITI